MEAFMKAWELHDFGLEYLKIAEKPVPKPAPNELLVRIGAVSLNYRDKLLYDGLHNPDLHFPMIPVADAAGEVVETGKDVTRFRPGDRIISHYATRWLDGVERANKRAAVAASSLYSILGNDNVLYHSLIGLASVQQMFGGMCFRCRILGQVKRTDS
jgi:NADPH:quinone reductase-like Zn-dependent oxidoreductase